MEQEISCTTEYGDWRSLGGQKRIDDSIFPQRMEIDYVSVYQEVK